MTRSIALLSDLHAEFAPFDAKRHWQQLSVCDAIVLAGDVVSAKHPDITPITWAQDNLPSDVLVIFVPGNHDFYHGNPNRLLDVWRDQCQGTNIHMLYNEAYDWNGVSILGTPLWSGLNSQGVIVEANLKRSIHRQISDFGCIEKWSVSNMLFEYQQAVAFLEKELQTPNDTLVVTHWCPHHLSTHPMYQGDPLTAYFVNHLPELVEQSNVWLHGHTHEGCEYQVGSDPNKGRVICHPRGYPTEERRRGVAYAPLYISI